MLAQEEQLNQHSQLEHIQYLPSPPSGQESADKLSARKVLEAVLRQRWIFTSVFLGVLSLGALYIFGTHKKYASKMELLVQNARSAQVISAGRAEAPASLAEVTDEELNSEIEILQSADVLDEVVDPGWGKRSASEYPKELQQLHEGKVSNLQRNLLVAPIRKSHLISVQLVARDPYEATRTLKRLLEVFLQKKLQINHPAGASELFTQQADDYSKQWRDAERQLANFQQEHGIVSIGDQEGGLQKQLFDADTQLRDANVEISELERKLRSDNDQLAKLPNRRATHETEIPASGSIDQLRTRLNELMLSRTELVSKYKAGDRLIVQVDEQIAQVKAALKDINGSYYSETSTDINPTWQLVEQDLSNTQSKLDGLIGRRKELASQILSLNEKLSSTESQTDALNMLHHKVAELETNYQVYAQKRDESIMTDVLDQHQLLNVAVALTPTFSLSQVRPLPSRDGILTLLTAIFLSSFAVFLAEGNRSTIADARELESLSRYPLLASIPRSKEFAAQTETADLLTSA